MNKKKGNNVRRKNQNQEQQNQSTQIIATVLAIVILVVAVIGISFAAFTYTQAGEKENSITTGSITMLYTEGEKGISIEDAMPVSDEVGKEITDAVGSSDSGTDLDSGAGHLADGASGVFDFSVTSKITGTTSINYDVVAHKISGDLDEQYVKLYLEKSSTSGSGYSNSETGEPKRWTEKTDDGLEDVTEGSTTTTQGLDTSSYKLLHSDSFTGTGGNHYYRLRMWVADDYGSEDEAGESFGSKKSFSVQVDVYGQAAS